MSSRIAAKVQEAAGPLDRQDKVRRRSIFSAFIRDPKALTGLIIFSVFVLVGIFAPLIAPYDPHASTFMPSQPPSWQHLFGTTNTGQDIFSQFVWGTRTSLSVGVGAAVVSTLIAFLIGVYAGLKGGWVDAVLNALCNIFLVLPGLALLILIESYLKNTTPVLNGLIIALTGWAWGARVFRSVTLSLANRDFVLAAKLSGAGSLRIMFAEILPNMVSIIAGNLIYSCLGAILAESGLAYLGFEDVASDSWGTILMWAQNGAALMIGAWWWFVPPGLAIALVCTSLTLMNFAVDQIANPRLRVKRRARKTHVLEGGLQHAAQS
ncbi:hypothetical protein GCM10010885_04300 [Alicyclobacillus cellulosilyticus]|uniref:ABC transmembrane type-1 domain-containing protein n=1 Tax=Alicyclobacillus cellulosilyticus TaxID=1003997 RepID=A0A917NG09_9BACL|nr:ABC transporter permease [Alicyclobacillus cellulosilyticus]GGI97759.1 hypothetical protein GCM10010885_04300 [Alicyclobacillus cellulosilyticus]